MDFRPEAFPLYVALSKKPNPGLDCLRDDIAKAASGGPDEKYKLALGLYGMVTNPQIAPHLPNVTPDIIEATKKQAFEIFDDVARNDINHGYSWLMLAECYLKGHGCTRSPQAAYTSLLCATSINSAIEQDTHFANLMRHVERELKRAGDPRPRFW